MHASCGGVVLLVDACMSSKNFATAKWRIVKTTCHSKSNFALLPGSNVVLLPLLSNQQILSSVLAFLDRGSNVVIGHLILSRDKSLVSTKRLFGSQGRKTEE